ncbi:MAG: SpoVR family protein [Myxococcales bacterium]|nr:SpoVR family protein [Myxococcales bacterium]
MKIGRNLPPELAALQEEIEGYARGYGLDFFPQIFEVLDYDQINQVAAYGGFPIRYPHWRFGMDYERLSKGYEYGLQKIYEMVINNNPCYAYLLESNSYIDQKIVMAHVYAHNDFFKNNEYFKHTNRRMIDEMANHAIRVRRYIDRYGLEEVETFLDVCLSLDNLIDYYSPYFEDMKLEDDEDDGIAQEIPKFRVEKEYMHEYINPDWFLDEQRRKMDKEKESRRRFPRRAVKDVLWFLSNYAPLTSWQRDVLAIIREESYYFAPQGQTKILNEGWASFWHSTILTKKAAKDSEIIDFAIAHSGVVATSREQLNPYKLGIELLRDIEERWDKGRFGKEYDECDDMRTRTSWDRQLGLGREKIFQVRKIYNDVNFIDEFLTQDFCERHGLFGFDYNRSTGRYEISTRDFKQIKEKLLFQLTNFGQPFIYVLDANFENRAELLLGHRHEGVDLRLDYAKAVLENIHKLWKRPTHVSTRMDNKGRLLSFDGKEHHMREFEYVEFSG